MMVAHLMYKYLLLLYLVTALYQTQDASTIFNVLGGLHVYCLVQYVDS